MKRIILIITTLLLTSSFVFAIEDELTNLSNINETLSPGIRTLYGRVEGRSNLVLYDKVDCNKDIVGYKHGKRGTWNNGILGCGFKEIKDALYMNSTGAPTGAGGSMFMWVDTVNLSNINTPEGVTIEISNYDDLYLTMHKYIAVRNGNLGWFDSPNTSTNGQWEALGEGTSGKSIYFGTKRDISSQAYLVATRNDALSNNDYASGESANANIPITYVTWLNATHFNFTRNGTILIGTSARTHTSTDGRFILYIGGTDGINVAHYIFNYTIYNGTSWSYSNYSLVSRMFNASNTQNISYTISYANLTWYGDMDGLSLSCALRTGTTNWVNCTNNTNVYLNGLFGIQLNLTAITTDPHRIPKIDRYVLAMKIANYTIDSSVNDSETANTGVETGIRGSLPDSKIYSNQLVYVRTKSNQHALARFDKVAVFGSQRWAFNYILPNDVSIGTFYNITPKFYFLEMQNRTYWNITASVGKL
ncbi:MAG: hypothetical protein AABY14_01065, partial [Nanoarchaeota archaeon]